MIECHTDYMLGVWIEQGEAELVKAMKEVFIFPQAGSAVVSRCARILSTGEPGSNIWDQVSDMITALYENKLVTKSDIDAGMVALAHTVIGQIGLNRFGEFSCLLASKNLYTVEQLCIATSAVGVFTRITLIRVCMERMITLVGLEFTKEYFCEPRNRSLLEECLGEKTFSQLLVEFNLIRE